MYRDFGTNYNAEKDTDPSILHTAAMSYIRKCAGLCLANEINNLDDQAAILRIVKDTIATNK